MYHLASLFISQKSEVRKFCVIAAAILTKFRGKSMARSYNGGHRWLCQVHLLLEIVYLCTNVLVCRVATRGSVNRDIAFAVLPRAWYRRVNERNNALSEERHLHCVPLWRIRGTVGASQKNAIFLSLKSGLSYLGSAREANTSSKKGGLRESCSLATNKRL